jgi:hypothetical protein
MHNIKGVDDVRTVPLSHLVQQLRAGSPNNIELLFIDPLLKTPVWDDIVLHRDLFLTNNIFASHIGASYTHNATANKLLAENNGSTSSKLLKHRMESLRYLFQLSELYVSGEIKFPLEQWIDSLRKVRNGEVSHDEYTNWYNVRLRSVTEMRLEADNTWKKKGENDDAIDAILFHHNLTYLNDGITEYPNA